MDDERLFWMRELLRGIAEDLHECNKCKNKFYEDLVCVDCVDSGLWEITDGELEEYVEEAVGIIKGGGKSSGR